MEMRCSRCGAAMECNPEGDCWCKELPRMAMAADAKACMCAECLKGELKKIVPASLKND